MFPAEFRSLQENLPSKKIEVWWQDKARAGQRGTLRRQWANKGTRPWAVRQQQFISTKFTNKLSIIRKLFWLWIGRTGTQLKHLLFLQISVWCRCPHTVRNSTQLNKYGNNCDVTASRIAAAKIIMILSRHAAQRGTVSAMKKVTSQIYATDRGLTPGVKLCDSYNFRKFDWI